MDCIVFVTAYVGIKQNDLAVARPQKARDAHSVPLTVLKVNPAYDPLRNDPRFQHVLREMNFPL